MADDKPTVNSSRNGGLRDRRGETLFIDARKLGHLVDRARRALSSRRLIPRLNGYADVYDRPTENGQTGEDFLDSLR